MSEIKVVHLTSVHRSLDQRIYYKECLTLAANGYEVVLIAPDASKDPGPVRLRSVPRAHGRIERVVRTVWRVYTAAINEHADLYHFHDAELIPVGVMLRLRGSRVVYDVHENLSKQILAKHWIPRLLRSPVSWAAGIIESFTSTAFFSGIVAATPDIAQRFPKSRTVVVQNFPRVQTFANCGPKIDGECDVVYVGGVSEIRGAREMVDALELVNRSRPARLALAGPMDPPALKRELEQMPGWRHVEWQDWRPQPEILSILKNAKIGVVPIHPTPNHQYAHPVKLFEYMLAGLPVIVSDLPLMREVVERHQCGISVPASDPVRLAEAICWLLDNPAEAQAMGRRGQEAAIQHYCWEAQATKLLDLYASLLHVTGEPIAAVGVSARD